MKCGVLGVLLAASWGACASAGCDNGKVACAPLCMRAKACRAEVAKAMVARLPNRSPALRHVRQELQKELLDRVIGSCEKRCLRLRSSHKWQRALAPCDPNAPCERFAPCIVGLLEP